LPFLARNGILYAGISARLERLIFYFGDIFSDQDLVFESFLDDDLLFATKALARG